MYFDRNLGNVKSDLDGNVCLSPHSMTHAFQMDGYQANKYKNKRGYSTNKLGGDIVADIPQKKKFQKLPSMKTDADKGKAAFL